NVDELFAMEHCNYNKESINNLSESSSSEDTITIVKGSEKSDSDYASCKASIVPEKKICKVKYMKKNSGNKKAKPKRNLT
ncbi:15017_t:CDS:1, partial [Funneliformis geosporum]